ncbi:conserved hypothetical protein [Vibrio chagasii]|nr:conserved hypothetical protein [Vibrio chagasii]CAH6870363.1 conserved hypothetical protein [Vibrio chagasii]CAH6901367.1 conserved hypothetical protein [Vibrio chagasii]CAH7156166.1 conserved hypothetical protein [Vibrio chagasii]CAH7244467.1 conserved hypothetical protein [Vibrio chagasii]
MNRFITLFVSIVSFGSLASEPTELDWKDLRPVHAQNQIVLPEISYQQKLTLQKIFTLNQYNDPKSNDELATLKETLKSEGLDADELLKLRSEYIANQQRASETVTQDFDGKKVRIPGFLVPIAFSEPLVATEFLLVPTAGACIHMPPPPANQIVRVSYPEGYKVETVQYPVWVEGVISSKLTTDNVYLVDGDTDVTMGYDMNASLVVNYH